MIDLEAAVQKAIIDAGLTDSMDDDEGPGPSGLGLVGVNVEAAAEAIADELQFLVSECEKEKARRAEVARKYLDRAEAAEAELSRVKGELEEAKTARDTLHADLKTANGLVARYRSRFEEIAQERNGRRIARQLTELADAVEAWFAEAREGHTPDNQPLEEALAAARRADID